MIRSETARLIVQFHRDAEATAMQHGIPINLAKMIVYLRKLPEFTPEHEKDYVQSIVNSPPAIPLDWCI